MVWPRLVTAEAGSIVKFPIFRFLTRSVRPFFKNLVKNPCFQVFDKKCHRYLRDVVNFLKFDIVDVVNFLKFDIVDKTGFHVFGNIIVVF